MPWHSIVTRLSPLALLDQLQALEQRHRRVRQRHWGPRTLDLDLLLFADRQLASARLTLPHPGLLERAFVMIPLADVAPELELDGTERGATRQGAYSAAISSL